MLINVTLDKALRGDSVLKDISTSTKVVFIHTPFFLICGCIYVSMVKRKTESSGEGRYYRIVLKSPEQFTTFRIHDVGREGHAQRLTGRTDRGRWETQAWLINKEDAERRGRTLVATDRGAKKIFSSLTEPIQLRGDIFRAHPVR